jgi:hypothetical protein
LNGSDVDVLGNLTEPAIVNQDHDDPAAWMRVGSDVGSDLAYPRCQRGGRLRQIDRPERNDGTWLSIDLHDEVRSREPGYRMAILVEHRDIDVDNVHARSKWRSLRAVLRRRAKRGVRESVEEIAQFAPVTMISPSPASAH